MKELSGKKRKELKSKMAEALSDKITSLSGELQDILIDDLVTAFESRLSVLNMEQSNLHFYVEDRVKVFNTTI